jgi:hypothetical protein
MTPERMAAMVRLFAGRPPVINIADLVDDLADYDVEQVMQAYTAYLDAPDDQKERLLRGVYTSMGLNYPERNQ